MCDCNGVGASGPESNPDRSIGHQNLASLGFPQFHNRFRGTPKNRGRFLSGRPELAVLALFGFSVHLINGSCSNFYSDGSWKMSLREAMKLNGAYAMLTKFLIGF
jgi:hypothetical protein